MLASAALPDFASGGDDLDQAQCLSLITSPPGASDSFSPEVLEVARISTPAPFFMSSTPAPLPAVAEASSAPYVPSMSATRCRL